MGSEMPNLDWDTEERVSKSRAPHWVIFSHSAQLAGSELTLVPLISEALSHGKCITLVLPCHGPLVKVIESLGAVEIKFFKNTSWMTGRVPRLSGPLRLLLILLEAGAIRRNILNKHSDLVLVNSSLIPGPIVAASAKGVRVAVIVNECVRSNPDLKSFLPKAVIVRFLRKYSNPLIGVSQFAASQVGTPHFSYPDIRRADLKNPNPHKKKDTSGPKFLNFVIVGRVSVSKGQLDAVRAVGALNRMGIQIQLKCFGPAHNQDLKKLQKEIAKENVGHLVRYMGPIDDPSIAFMDADFSLNLSAHESYGRVTAESIYAGVPVIGYEIEGTREILQHGGGILVQPNVEALVGAIADLQNNTEKAAQIQKECISISTSHAALGNASDLIELIDSRASQ